MNALRPLTRHMTLISSLLALAACTSVSKAPVCPNPPQVPAALLMEPSRRDYLTEMRRFLTPSPETVPKTEILPSPATTSVHP